MSTDKYLAASNFRNISEIFYRKKNFHTSKKYLDSTLIHLSEKHKEFKPLKKKLDILTDVVKYQDIVSQADSVLVVSKMSDSDKIKYYQEYINKLKISDSIAAKKTAGNAVVANPNANVFSGDNPNENMLMPPGAGDGFPPGGNIATIDPMDAKKPVVNFPINTGGAQSSFYFYNPATVAQGKIDFKKKWGDKKLGDNWKAVAILNQNQVNSTNSDEVEEETTDKKEEIGSEPKYTTAFYINQLPKETKVLDSLELYKEGEVAAIIAKEEWFKQTGAHNRDCEDALDMIMSIAVVRIAFFVRIVNGESRVSLRSKGKIDVSKIAAEFGGGGHFNASGCTIETLDVEKAKEIVLKEIFEIYK